jgi:dynein heavy chain
LAPVEVDLLSARLAALDAALEPGLTRLNWNSRGIDAFVGATTKAVQEFQALHHSMRKSGAILEKLVNGLAGTQLVADLPAGGELATAVQRLSGGVCAVSGVPVTGQQVLKLSTTAPCVCVLPAAFCTEGEVMELQEFYEFAEQHRARVVETAVQRYRSLTPLLSKVVKALAWWWLATDSPAPCADACAPLPRPLVISGLAKT